MGPEHEFSVVDEQLRPLPIVDKIIRGFHGRVVNFVEQPGFTFGKELQLHVMEVKPNAPFKNPEDFEETMQEAILSLTDFVEKKYGASLLGTGMHPLLKLDETSVWPHRDRQVYRSLSRVFNLRRHGWLNIQSFQLNLPYSGERSAVQLHNLLAETCAYLPAVAASSPIYEGKLGEHVDSRLRFYMENQKEIPSVTGDVVPEYISSLRQYQRDIIGRYSSDLAGAGADKRLLAKDWVNSRGVVFRFDRRAFEIRVMDEQECVKSDVALSCFVRAVLRGMQGEGDAELWPHDMLVKDFRSIVRAGLSAETLNPRGRTARQACQHFFDVARRNATPEEKKYLPVVQKRIENGSLSEAIRKNVEAKAEKTDFRDAVITVYSRLIKSLVDNEPYF